ncbi:hypothetical protein [Clostridium gasigenes]|uniref:FkbH-like domain-containing protein n=1 Tax=Clostridium gasigenes TaxID=94869 RepID=A0A1H0PNT3_9CLOT|nr:hypothetical protein [Clostridium gasigenes]SDP06460.1 FkbH-like domain-containing protein [Clostridium gasigenes]
MNTNIKLVIWDLDDTFWNGTLSEGGIKVDENTVKIIKELSKRGIMNSVCSKNTFVDAKEELVKLDLWDYFIFPKIDWIAKGELVKQILDEVHLRSENVLFIDDNHLNRQEVSFYNENINVIDESFIPKILEHESFKGKQDLELSRLKQYKILEEKSTKKLEYTSNEKFLESCNIKIEILDNCNDQIERIYELIHRTNQLNYTKKRISKDELCKIINDKTRVKKYIKVYDEYGEYGICGFYCIEGDCLEHFLFSCRTMNLGIEQWVYANLNFPKIDVSGDVAYNLNVFDKPNWIKVKENESNIKNEKNKPKDVKCLIRGGCDLMQIYHYLNSTNIEVDTEFNYANNIGLGIHKEHTNILKQIKKLNEIQKKKLVEELPFYENDSFESKIYNQKYDVIIYSLLIDYTFGVYDNRKDGLSFVYGHYDRKFTDKSIREDIRKYYNNKLDDNFFNNIDNNYEFKGAISQEELQGNLRWLRNEIDDNTTLIILNGAEINIENSKEKDRYLHHIKMNKALDTVIGELNNTHIVDVRKYVTTEKNLVNDIRHYERKVYKEITEDIISIIEESKKIENNKSIKNEIRIKIEDFKKYIRVIKNKFIN